MEELAAARANRGVAWIPLFKGLYEVEIGRNAEAERTLLAVNCRPVRAASGMEGAARIRRALAIHRLGRVQEAAMALKDPATEGAILQAAPGRRGRDAVVAGPRKAGGRNC